MLRKIALICLVLAGALGTQGCIPVMGYGGGGYGYYHSYVPTTAPAPYYTWGHAPRYYVPSNYHNPRITYFRGGRYRGNAPCHSGWNGQRW